MVVERIVKLIISFIKNPDTGGSHIFKRDLGGLCSELYGVRFTAGVGKTLYDLRRENGFTLRALRGSTRKMNGF